MGLENFIFRVVTLLGPSKGLIGSNRKCLKEQRFVSHLGL